MILGPVEIYIKDVIGQLTKQWKRQDYIKANFLVLLSKHYS